MKRNSDSPRLTPEEEIAPILASEVKSKQLSSEAFFLLVQRWPARASSSVYLYRSWPVIDRRRAGITHKYINVFALDDDRDPLCAAKVTRLHGDGDYLLKLSDANRSKGYTEIAYAKLMVSASGVDPVIEHLAEIVEEDRRNKDFIQGLKARGAYNTQPQPQQGETTMADPTLATLATELVKQLRQSGNSGDVVEQLTKLQQLQGSPLDQALRLAQVFKPQDNGLKDMMPLLLEMMRRPAAAPEPVDKTFELLERAEKLFNRRGGGGGGGGGFPWEALVAGIPAALNGFSNLAQSYLAMRSGTPVPVPMPVQSPNPNQLEDQSMQQYRDLAVKALLAFRRQIPGDEWVDAMTVTDPTALDLLEGLSPDVILQFVAPSLPADVDQVGLRKWLDTVFTALASASEEAA